MIRASIVGEFPQREAPWPLVPGLFYWGFMPKGKTNSAAARLETFCQEYIKDGNITRSATVAGFSPKSACAQGSRMLKTAKCKVRLEQLSAEIAGRNAITVERVLKELGRLAFFDPRKLYDKDGNIKPIHELDDDTAAGVAGIDIDEIIEGKGADRRVVGYTKKFKQWDKNSALANAMRTLGLFKADNEQHNNPLKEMFELLNASRGRKGLI